MVTLNKPPAGDTDWTTEVNDNWTTIENSLNSIVQAGIMQGRLKFISTTEVRLERYKGDVVEVNGSNVSLGASGISVAPGDNLITSTGADAGASMAASTLYYLYVSNANASPFSSDLRASTTAPSLLNGVKYLGTSGNAANWRFVGYVRTNASTQFVDSETQRLVINYYNRRPLSLRITETTDSWTYSTATWRPWNNSTANRVEYISNDEDAVVLHFATYVHYNAALVTNVAIGIGLDSTTAPSSLSIYPGTVVSSAATYGMVAATFCGNPGEGYHYLQLLEIADRSTVFYGDAGVTYKLSGAVGWVMG